MTASKFTIDHAGTTVHCSISPCSWMHVGYGLQVQISLVPNAANAESVFTVNKSVEATVPPLSQLVTLGTAHARHWLKINGLAPLISARDTWAAKAAGYAIERAKGQEAADKAQAAKLAKYKAEGFTHHIVGWIHPRAGDDRMVEAFSKGEPSTVSIRQVLRGCTMKTDYNVTTL